MSTTTVYRPGMSKAEELAMMETAAEEIFASFDDPEHGDDNARKFFALFLDENGAPLPYFRNTFTPQALERLRKKPISHQEPAT